MTMSEAAEQQLKGGGTPADTQVSRLTFFDDRFVFDRVSGHFHRLNPTAAFVLRALDDGLDPTKLPELLQSHYDIDHETAIRDAELFVNELWMLGIMGRRNR